MFQSFKVDCYIMTLWDKEKFHWIEFKQSFKMEYFSGKSQVRFPRVPFLGWDFPCDFQKKILRFTFV